MNNLKEENIRRAIWHIKRDLDELLNSKNEEDREYCTFHLQSSIECLERVMSNKNTYLYLCTDSKKFTPLVQLFFVTYVFIR